MQTRKGFTLIELLVVIAIIGILAAMLFPVFARAREAARKIQCLSNTKNIALAVQMYLTDYDRFPPNNQDRDMLAMMDAKGDNGCSDYGEHRFNGGDPYLRWPVVLDEYIKNRDVWLCPSARYVNSTRFIVPQYTAVYWWYLRDNTDKWGRDTPCCGGPCCEAWPPGWGGSVTDSIGQGAHAEGDPQAFTWSIATTADESYNRSTSEIADPTAWVVCGDNQGASPALKQMWDAAYASACCWDLGDADSERFYQDASFRKQYAPHMGGLNLAFADGHAKWWPAEAAVQASGYCCRYEDGQGNYLDCAGHTTLGGTCPDFEVTDNIN